MTTAQPPRPLLLVLAHGVGAYELAAVRAAAGFGAEPTPLPLALPPEPVHAVLHELDAARELLDLGVDVDRSSLLLRPTGRTDATAIEALARRATGPAPVTLFEATSVLAQAVVGGPRAAADAACQLGALLGRLCAALRRGDLPECWFVGLGAPHPVQTTFDLETAWRRHVLPPLADDLSLRSAPGLATITGDNQRALDLAARLLRTAPFARRGALLPGTKGRLRFAAARGVAFGRQPVAARAAHAGETAAVVAAPIGDAAHRRGLDLAGLMARLWMHAAQLHAPLADVPEQQATPSRARPAPPSAAVAGPAGASSVLAPR